MNNNTLLISYDTLTKSSEIPENIDTKLIYPLIKEVQEMYIEPVIGSKLFEKLKADITTDTITGNYELLRTDFIKEVMIYGVLSDLCYKMNFRPTNIGFGSRTSEYLNNNSESDLQRISNYYKARREFYANRLASYLCANEDKFPEYRSESEPNEVRPKNTQYEVGIYLD